MADIREQEMTVKTTLADTDKLRVVTATSNETITIKQLEDTRGITQAKSDISQLQSDVASLVESGSNANGSWIKYSDGTMVIYRRLTVGGLMQKNTQVGTTGGGVRSYDNSLTFPESFINNETSVQATIQGNTVGADVKVYALNQTTCVLQFWSINPITIPDNTIISIFAIGRWK